MAVNNADDIVDVLLDHLAVLMRAHERGERGSCTRSPATTPSAVVT